MQEEGGAEDEAFEAPEDEVEGAYEGVAGEEMEEGDGQWDEMRWDKNEGEGEG